MSRTGARATVHNMHTSRLTVQVASTRSPLRPLHPTATLRPPSPPGLSCGSADGGDTIMHGLPTLRPCIQCRRRARRRRRRARRASAGAPPGGAVTPSKATTTTLSCCASIASGRAWCTARGSTPSMRHKGSTVIDGVMPS
eukprot:7391592-Prymnesium_polylepis.1